MASATDNFKVLTRLSTYIQDILGQTINSLTARFNQSRNVFTAASPFGQLLLVTENLTQLIFYYIEDSITELNINEASRLTSIYSLASLAGHNPSRSVSATGEISISRLAGINDFPSDVVIIPNLTKITCINNGLPYVIELPQDEVKFNFNGSSDGLLLNIRQGTVEKQTVTGTGQPVTSFSIGSPQNFHIDNFYVSVYVNGEKWKKYDSILDIPRNEKGFIARTGITSGLDIYFGNYNYGKIPQNGAEIVVEYIVNDGVLGNIRTDDASAVEFEFVDTGFSLLGEEINLNEVIEITTTNSPFFGMNPEDSKLTKIIAPKQSKSFALVNADHYETVLRKLRLFSIINVYLDEIDNRLLNLFLVPDIRKTFANPQDYFNANLDRFIMNDFQKNSLLQYIEKCGTKLISTDIRIIDPIPSEYVLNVSIIVFDDVTTDIIKRDILNNIATFFIQTTRRNRIPKSDIIKIIEEINGVDSVSVNIVCKKNELAKIANPAAADVGIDSFNDIIISERELPLIRGGFTDRYGNIYSSGITEDALGPVNIQIKDIVPRKMQ
jgi:hypothetical protein